MNRKNILMVVLAVMLIITGIAAANISPGVSDTTGTDVGKIVFDTTPPAEVTELHVTGATTSTLTWGWTNPADDDFVNTVVKVEKAQNGAIIVEHVKVSGLPTELGFYTAIGLEPGTSYKITIQTQDNAPEIATISLCTKTIKPAGEPWGYCDNAETKGSFEYATSGSSLRFNANASGLTGADGTSYSLIYYKDTDATHQAPSTVPVNVLATGTSSGNAIDFAGVVPMSGNIPASDDVNPRGKIWIVPTSQITGNNGLMWSGYAVGATMADYLFESDSNTSLPIPESMGGITFTHT